MVILLADTGNIWGNAGLMEGRLKVCGSYTKFALPSVSQLGNVQLESI